MNQVKHNNKDHISTTDENIDNEYIRRLLSEIPDPPSLHSEIFKVDDKLIAEIYTVVDKILHDPPLHAWFDPNYQTLEQTFTIQVIDDVAYVDVIADHSIAVNRYKVKDYSIKLENGKWEPDLEAIKNIKIYYDVFS